MVGFSSFAVGQFMSIRYLNEKEPLLVDFIGVKGHSIYSKEMQPFIREEFVLKQKSLIDLKLNQIIKEEARHEVHKTDKFEEFFFY